MIKCPLCKYECDISNDCNYWGCDQELVEYRDNCSDYHRKHGAISLNELKYWFELERKRAIIEGDIYTENHFSWLLERLNGSPRELRDMIVLWHSETENELKDLINEKKKEFESICVELGYKESKKEMNENEI